MKIINICWSPDGRTTAVCNKDDLITFIDVRSHRSNAEEQFKFEVNEISWNNDWDLFFLTSGQGSIDLLSYPGLKLQYTLNAHPANFICIEFDPKRKTLPLVVRTPGQYFGRSRASLY
eukprot:XP_019920954.1 PREDICTED: THO complex subunit 3 [Crassostrea gigas]